MNLLRTSKKYAVWQRVAFALGGISMVSLLSRFLTAMMKRHFTWSYPSLASTYLLLLVIAVLGTQVVEYRLSRRHRKKR